MCIQNYEGVMGTPSPSETEENILLYTLIWLQGKEELHIELEKDITFYCLMFVILSDSTILSIG
jgi:hypothetical protein